MLRSHSLPDLFRSAMREMLDAAEEIWLNIFLVEYLVGGGVRCDFPGERTSVAR
jgi:hypothetical protein